MGDDFIWSNGGESVEQPVAPARAVAAKASAAMRVDEVIVRGLPWPEGADYSPIAWGRWGA